MIDIVDRLRFDATRCELQFSKGVAGNLNEAADEIERLRRHAQRAPMRESGEAVIEDGSIVIRVALEALPMILEGAWAMNKFDTHYKITDASEFAKELMHALNREDEQGTTPIHELFDGAILHVIEQGGFGIDEESTLTSTERCDGADDLEHLDGMLDDRERG